MSKFIINVEHKPMLGPEEVLSGTDMRARLWALPVQWKRVKLTDNWFFIPTWEGWRKAIDYLKPKVPKYYRDKFDCENTAGWFRHKMADVFGINTLAEVEGYADMQDGKGPQRHGWGLFTDTDGCYQLETQTGVVMDIDDKWYIPDEIVMG